MNHNRTVTEQMLGASSVTHLEDVLDFIDQLHSAASEEQRTALADMNETELISYLRDIIYTAQETIEEVEASQRRHQKRRKPSLRILPRKAG